MYVVGIRLPSLGRLGTGRRSELVFPTFLSLRQVLVRHVVFPDERGLEIRGILCVCFPLHRTFIVAFSFSGNFGFSCGLARRCQGHFSRLFKHVHVGLWDGGFMVTEDPKKVMMMDATRGPEVSPLCISFVLGHVTLLLLTIWRI